MELLNPVSRYRIIAESIPENIVHQRDLLDNNVDYIVVGVSPHDTKITVEYTFKLPIADRALIGSFYFLIEGTSVDFGNDYSYVEPEIGGVTFSASVVSGEVRLNIVTSSLGENPTLFYRLKKTP